MFRVRQCMLFFSVSDCSLSTRRMPCQTHHITFPQWRRQVDQAARPFAFIHYDPVIQRKQRDFREPSQCKSKLSEDLSEIQSIMRQNIDQILNRGEKLDHVSSVSQELKSKSKDFKWGAQKVSWQVRMQQYGAMAAGCFLVLLVIGVKVFHIGFPE